MLAVSAFAPFTQDGIAQASEGVSMRSIKKLNKNFLITIAIQYSLERGTWFQMNF